MQNQSKIESLLTFLKKGNKIKIKPENKGKFSSYCGGKVTEACIQRGLRSSNPTTRKRANFARNVRRWSKKHQFGGIIDEPIVKPLIEW